MSEEGEKARKWLLENGFERFVSICDGAFGKNNVNNKVNELNKRLDRLESSKE